VVYDAGGPADGTLTTCGGTLNGTGYPPCGTSTIGKTLANTVEQVSLPTNLRVPGSVYCANADCTGKSIQTPASDPPSVCTTSTTGCSYLFDQTFNGPNRSALGRCRGLAGLPWPEQFHRIR